VGLLVTGAVLAESTPIDEVLAPFSVEARDLRPDPSALLASRDAAGQSPLLRGLLLDPWQAAYRIGMLERRYASRHDSVHRQYQTTATLSGADIARGYIGNPLARIDAFLLAQPDPLVGAVQLLRGVGIEISETAQAPTLAELPNPFRFEFSRLLSTIAQAEDFRRRAFRDLPPDLTADLIRRQLSGSAGATDLDYRLHVDTIEPEALHAGMLDLVAATEDFAHFLGQGGDLPAVDWHLKTSAGFIVLRGAPDSEVYVGDPPLLLVDLRGNDRYEFADGDSTRTISIVYDHEGDDEFSGAVARSALGYAIHWDARGNDVYDGNDFTQSSATFGAALLFDGEGNDEYRARFATQGYAVAGAALLLDHAGNDSYQALSYAQASAGPRAAATLRDAAGNDNYALTATPLIRPSAQLADRNVSAGQGVGWGIRADLIDGRSLAGGVGLLLDGDGNDTYRGQVICQGSGFLEGVGALVDHAGSDDYEGAWYAQASGAHRAIGILIDRGNGNDRHHATHYSSVGTAHDASLALLVNDGGNDTYHVRNLGLGGTNDGGFSILQDAGGNDHYTIHDRAGHGLGSARITHYGTTREESLGTGIFFDLGGEDRYDLRRPGAGNNTMWLGPAEHPDLLLPSERGAAWDGTWPTPLLRTTARTSPSDTDTKALQEALAARRAYREKY
jgi:hypothetical protein